MTHDEAEASLIVEHGKWLEGFCPMVMVEEVVLAWVMVSLAGFELRTGL
jgi:hypothetical protein